MATLPGATAAPTSTTEQQVCAVVGACLANLRVGVAPGSDVFGAEAIAEGSWGRVAKREEGAGAPVGEEVLRAAGRGGGCPVLRRRVGTEERGRLDAQGSREQEQTERQSEEWTIKCALQLLNERLRKPLCTATA